MTDWEDPTESLAGILSCRRVPIGKGENTAVGNESLSGSQTGPGAHISQTIPTSTKRTNTGMS